MTEAAAPRIDPRLTSLRGIAAGWVAAVHGLSWEGVAHGLFGAFGVQVFLGLSMNLLMRSLDRNRDLWHYFRRRIVRIWPPYFAVCLLLYLLYDPNLTRLVLNLTFLAVFVPGGIFQAGGVVNPGIVLWTLQIEEFAYLFIPLVHRLSEANQLRVGVGLIAVSVTFAVTVQGAWALGWWTDPATAPYLITYSYQLPLLWVGCYGTGLLAYLGRWPRVVWTLPLLGVAAALWHVPGGFPAYLAMMLALPFFGAVLQRPPTWLRAFPLVVLGEISYSLYLLHDVWYRAFGVLGALGTLPSAAALEYAVRGREMTRRLRAKPLST